MKKVAVLFICVMSFALAKAQPNNVVSAYTYLQSWLNQKDFSDLKKGQARIDTAANNPSTSGKAKTWVYRAQIYEAIFEKNFADSLAKIPEAKKDRTSLAYLSVGVSELETAILSYKKAIDLDTKNDYSDDAKKFLRICVEDYSYKANSLASAKRYEEAVEYSEKSFDFTQKLVGKTDTFTLNQAAICAMRAKQYDKSISLYEKLIAIHYKPLIGYGAIIELYKQKGDDAGYKASIEKARVAYPNEYSFILDELNLALKEGKIDEAIKNLNLAIEKDPKNAELHLVLAQTYQKMAWAKPKPANFDELLKKSETEYQSAVDVKPDYFTGFYNYGVFYNNLGILINDDAQKLTKMQDIQAEEKKANAVFLKAIPLLEKAMELNPTDKDTMKALKQLYAKTNQTDTEKYKKIVDLLKN